MASRLDLHEELCEILGTRNAYFQPPSNVQMKYDAIRYELGAKDLKRANNGIYQSTNCYEGVIITRDPDSDLPDKLLAHFKMCSLARPYPKDNLIHYPFTLYY